MSRMLRLLPLSVLTLARLALAGPAAAHVPAVTPPPVTLEIPQVAETVPSLSAAPAGPVLPWYLPAALALVAGARGRRPRGALLVALALLLGVFAFENALHSVHHGVVTLPQEQCAAAAVSAQLAAVEVDGAGLVALAPAIIGLVGIAPPPFARSRCLSPAQGRAPPSAIR